MRGHLGRLIATVVLLSAAPAAHAASPFADWAVIIVAGDDHAHSGAHSEVFDNARRDLASAFAKVGFSPANIAQYSVHPDDYPTQRVLGANPPAIADGLDRLAGEAKGGCLVYVTSHGGADNLIVLGDGILTAAGLSGMVDAACHDRPSVVIISACFSGTFIPPLSSPDRMVMTAARPDRTSFGCGEADRYTYFDACMLQELPLSHDFPALGRAVQACVAKRETDLGVGPPSEPQVWIGPALAPDLPLLTFSGAS